LTKRNLFFAALLLAFFVAASLPPSIHAAERPPNQIVTMLPESLKQPLPDALDRKYPKAPAEWRWHWAFPQENPWKNTKTGEEGRHHVHETILQRAVKEAVRKAGLVKHVGCHTFRHYAELGITGIRPRPPATSFRREP